MKRWLGVLAICAVLCAVGLLAAFARRPAASPGAATPGNATSAAPELDCPTGTRALHTEREDFCAVVRDGAPVRQGPAVRWSQSEPHTVEARGSYRNGLRHGLWTGFYPSQARKSLTHYIEGRENGHAQRWYESGALKAEGEFIDGQRHGVWTHYYEDGSKSESGGYWMGKRLGDWTGWYPNGNRRYLRLYTANGSDSWTEWDEGGRVVARSPEPR